MEFTYFLAFNRLVSKHFYRIQTRLVAAEDVVFLNIGYEEDPPMGLPLAESDEPNRFHIQLYHRIATQADLRGKRVLEVGCGHGGAASYFMRTLRPASYTGLDLNRAAVAYCRKRHNLPGVDFVHGDAEKLPFPDQSFDAVINVESSAAYPHFSRFLAEVARVLRPGGHFLYTDLRPRNNVAEWETALAGAPMRMLSHEEINAQVVRGLEKNTPRILDLIGRVPAILHPIGRAYSGVEGTAFYRAMQSGKYSYRMYCFVRSEASGTGGIRTPPPLASASTNLLKAVLLRVTWIPRVTQFLAKYLYPIVTRLVSKDDVIFLNYGYEEDPPMALPLAASDEPDRYPIQLYHRTATQVDLGGKRVLEVSCGHGGGASYLMRTVQPASYTGVDLNPTGVNFCRKRHNVPGLDFVQGNAEKLRFADESFDAVINVEASHCYAHCRRFLAEVARMLRPGGHFLYTDLRSRRDVTDWEAAIADAPLRLLSRELINEQVVRGLGNNSQRLQDQFGRRLPNIGFLHGIARDFVGGPGSRSYDDLVSGQLTYQLFCFTKD
jgi:ubiquinone/menaquinone biosynthesis C-methylase UbiE